MPRPPRALACHLSEAHLARVSAELTAAGWLIATACDTDAIDVGSYSVVIIADSESSPPWRDLLARLEKRGTTPIILLTDKPSSPWIDGAVRNRRLAAAIPLEPAAGHLLSVCGMATHIGDLRSDLARERDLAKRRIAGLGILGDITAAAANLSTVPAIVDMAIRHIGRVVRFDFAAILAAIEGSSPALHLHCEESCDASLMRAVRDRCIESYSTATGRSISEDQLEVTVTGRPMLDAGFTGRPPITTQVPLVSSGHTCGIMFISSPNDQAIDTEARRLLYLLANRIADILVGLATRQTEERQRLAMMVESMADGLLFTSSDGADLIINPAARRMLGVDDSVAVTRSFLKDTLGFYPFDLVSSSDAGGEPLREEVSVGDKVLHSIVSPVRDAAGILQGVVVVLRDFSEAVALERRQADFVAAVSHELRSPITSITGALDIVLSDYAGRLNDKQRRYAELARESCGNLSRAIDDLLDVARAEHSGVAVNLSPMSLDALGREVAERYRLEADTKQIRMLVKAELEPIRIAGDAERLTQVLNNLLSNAIKFTPSGGFIEVAIFGPSVASNQVGVAVFNNGDPIPEADRERIFEKFERKGTDRFISGTGLGLAISRAIVEAHGGRIWVEPRQDGTQFVFTLPAAPNLDESDKRASGDTNAAAGTPATPAKVLLVGDEDRTAYILKGMLMADGHTVLVASTAEDALALARTMQPALIVLSSESTDDTLAILRTAKHDPDTRNSALLVVTNDDREMLMSAGADDVAVRPIEPARFRERCSRLISEARRARAHRVLVVDDDRNIRSICREVLESGGYIVKDVANGAHARLECQRFRPHLVLLDVMMPGTDGFDLAEKLRSDSATSMIPIIFVSAKSETADKVRAFRLGAEDYIVKPFVAAELLARVSRALERRERELGASPTTQLPGADSIETEFERRLAQGEPYAFCYLDLDNLKAFNDYYGYAKADGIIRQTGDLLRDITARQGTGKDFLGHIAGDDFVFSTSEAAVDDLCRTLTESFDRLIPLYYNKADRERGFIEATDRFGVLRKFPLMTISICAVTVSGSHPTNYSELATYAAAGKKTAKELIGSSYVRDGRPILGREPDA